MFKQLVFGVLLFFITTDAFSHSSTKDGISVTHAWSRAVPVVGMNGAGYMIISNNSEKAVRLIHAKTEIAGKTSLHETTKEGEMVSMQAIPNGILIPANSRVELKPGGKHIMLMKLKKTLDEGQQIPVTLVFESGLEVETYFAIQPLGGDHLTHH